MQYSRLESDDEEIYPMARPDRDELIAIIKANPHKLTEIIVAAHYGNYSEEMPHSRYQVLDFVMEAFMLKTFADLYPDFFESKLHLILMDLVVDENIYRWEGGGQRGELLYNYVLNMHRAVRYCLEFLYRSHERSIEGQVIRGWEYLSVLSDIRKKAINSWWPFLWQHKDIFHTNPSAHKQYARGDDDIDICGTVIRMSCRMWEIGGDYIEGPNIMFAESSTLACKLGHVVFHIYTCTGSSEIRDICMHILNRVISNRKAGRINQVQAFYHEVLVSGNRILQFQKAIYEDLMNPGLLLGPLCEYMTVVSLVLNNCPPCTNPKESSQPFLAAVNSVCQRQLCTQVDLDEGVLTALWMGLPTLALFAQLANQIGSTPLERHLISHSKTLQILPIAAKVTMLVFQSNEALAHDPSHMSASLNDILKFYGSCIAKGRRMKQTNSKFLEILRQSHAAWLPTIRFLQTCNAQQYSRFGYIRSEWLEMWMDYGKRAGHRLDGTDPLLDRPEIGTAVVRKPTTKRMCGSETCLCSRSRPKGHRYMKVCDGCWLVFYCGEKCQERDWLAGHRDVCRRRA